MLLLKLIIAAGIGNKVGLVSLAIRDPFLSYRMLFEVFVLVVIISSVFDSVGNTNGTLDVLHTTMSLVVWSFMVVTLWGALTQSRRWNESEKSSLSKVVAAFEAIAIIIVLVMGATVPYSLSAAAFRSAAVTTDVEVQNFQAAASLAGFGIVFTSIAMLAHHALLDANKDNTKALIPFILSMATAPVGSLLSSLVTAAHVRGVAANGAADPLMLSHMAFAAIGLCLLAIMLLVMSGRIIWFGDEPLPSPVEIPDVDGEVDHLAESVVDANEEATTSNAPIKRGEY